MKEVRVLEIKESVFADNDRQADNLRRELKEQGVFLMNLMRQTLEIDDFTGIRKDYNTERNDRAVKGSVQDRCDGSGY